jgi:hypothetical protein
MRHYRAPENKAAVEALAGAMHQDAWAPSISRFLSEEARTPSQWVTSAVVFRALSQGCDAGFLSHIGFFAAVASTEQGRYRHFVVQLLTEWDTGRLAEFRTLVLDPAIHKAFLAASSVPGRRGLSPIHGFVSRVARHNDLWRILESTRLEYITFALEEEVKSERATGGATSAVLREALQWNNDSAGEWLVRHLPPDRLLTRDLASQTAFGWVVDLRLLQMKRTAWALLGRVPDIDIWEHIIVHHNTFGGRKDVWTTEVSPGERAEYIRAIRAKDKVFASRVDECLTKFPAQYKKLAARACNESLLSHRSMQFHVDVLPLILEYAFLPVDRPAVAPSTGAATAQSP